MAIAKRVFLFITVNILVMTTVMITFSILQSFFGFEVTGGLTGLAIFSLLFGFISAFISLFMSKFMAKWMMGVRVIDPQTRDSFEREYLEKVYELSRKAKLPKMPEVGIYDSPEINAFATGPSKSNSLVAVSTGLLQRMNKDEVEGVLGHEVAHIANGDMVTMTLIQGIINAIVIFASRLLANIISNQVDERLRGVVFFTTAIILQIALSILGSVVVAYFSRIREYRADTGGAKLAGKQKMIDALQALAGTEEMVDNQQEAMASLKISGQKRSALAMAFSTHPPLEDRILALQKANIN